MDAINLISVLTGHTSRVNAVATSPTDPNILLTASSDTVITTIGAAVICYDFLCLIYFAGVHVDDKRMDANS